MWRFVPIWRSTTSSVSSCGATSSRSTSPSAWPPTSASPRPQCALMTMWSSRPVSGSPVNAMPAATAGNIGMMTTAIARSAVSMPKRSRYANACGACAESHTARTASASACAPMTFRRVSWMPANERCAESSCGADERTASGAFCQPRAVSASVMAASTASGTPSPRLRPRLASATSTKPSGTGTPSIAIRPSCQPLPPATAAPAAAAAGQSSTSVFITPPCAPRRAGTDR